MKCLLCEKTYSYCDGTTNLRDHLSSQHSLTYTVKQVKPGSSKSQLSLDKYAKPVFCSESKSKSITDAIVDIVAEDVRPCYIVKRKGFRRLMNVMEPGYKVPSVNHINLLVWRKYEVVKEELKALLREVAASASMTT